jgi:hypothetical protein
MSDFSNEYIASCIEQGKTTPVDICESARKEISSLEEEIKKIEIIRTRQSGLRSVIRQLGGVEVIKKTKRAPMIVDPLITEQQLDPYVKQVCVKVCDYIETQHPLKLKPRDIMDAVASLEENRFVLTAIKWLWDHAIIERQENSLVREISKGKNWNQRPV